MGKNAEEVVAYLQSNQYEADLKQKIGVCLTGNPPLRAKLFMLMARPYAMEGRSVYYTSLASLAYALDEADVKAKMLSRVAFLFVERFEVTFSDDAIPLSVDQRFRVEEFLLQRLNAGRITNFSASDEWMKLKWWSAQFLRTYKEQITDLRVYN
jgi:hypothetical protein